MKHLSFFGIATFVLLATFFNPFNTPSSYAVPCVFNESAGEFEECPSTTHRCVQESGSAACKELCPRGNASGTICATGQFCNSQNKCANTSDVSASNPDGDPRGSLDGGLVPCGGPGQEQCQLRDIFVLLHDLLEFAIFQLAPILVTAMVALGGFFILTSAGNPGRYAKGLDYIKYSLIGYGIVLVSMLLVNTLLQQLGVATWTGLLNWEIINF